MPGTHNYIDGEQLGNPYVHVLQGLVDVQKGEVGCKPCPIYSVLLTQIGWTLQAGQRPRVRLLVLESCSGPECRRVVAMCSLLELVRSDLEVKAR